MLDFKKILFSPLSLFLCIVIIWQLPYGNYICYPFTILSTYFHEISHGFTALLLGGDFLSLDLNSDGSGTAYHTNNLFLGSIGNGIVALSGPIGPTLFGYLILKLTNEKNSKVILSILLILLLLSTVVYVRTLFGILFLLLIMLLLGYLLAKGTNNLIYKVLNIIALQAFFSMCNGIGYFFSKGGIINGKTYSSDTYIAEQTLILPYWIWATLIILLSIVLLLDVLTKSLNYKTTNEHLQLNR